MEFIVRTSLIPTILEKVREAALQSGLEPQAALQVEVAMEEVLTNILKHGYHGQPGRVTLQLEVVPNESLTIEVRDEAPPFNITGVPESYDRNLPLEERPIGGLGIPLIKAFFDELEWKPRDPGNALRLRRLVL
jgi:anti-sigma regulatory factor (Ser/Thr protein kinase)